MNTDHDSQTKNLQMIGRSSVVDDVIERVTNLILDEGLQPGEQLATERDLMARLGVGRSSLREAIKTLCALGVLEIRHGTGTFISTGNSSMLTRPIKWGLFLSETSVKGVIESRAVIEVALTRWAAERAAPEDIERLRDRLLKLEESRDDLPNYIENDLAFHMEIAEASGNEMLATVLAMMQCMLRAWMETTFTENPNTDHSMKLHRQIFNAIEDHDADAAARAMEIHVAGSTIIAAAARRFADKVSPINAFGQVSGSK